MSKNRKETEKYIISYVNKIMPNKSNQPLYEKMFSAMSDKDFDNFINDLKTGKRFIIIVCPNFTENGLSIERNLKIAKELKLNFFQKIWFPETANTPKYLSPIPYMVLDLPIRRLSQLLDKKISIPEDQNSVDILTGQPAGKSKAAKVNYAELQVLAAMNLDNSIIELIKMRGGDENGYRALNMSLKKTGHVNLDILQHYATGVESTRTLKTYLTGAHLKNTL